MAAREVKDSPLWPYWSMPDDHLLGKLTLGVVDPHMVDGFLPARGGDMFLPGPFGFCKLAAPYSILIRVSKGKPR